MAQDEPTESLWPGLARAAQREPAALEPLLGRALAELPEPSRLALLMHVLGDCPYREIAAALGESEVGVRVRVHRARQRLRQLLRTSFYDPEERCDEQ